MYGTRTSTVSVTVGNLLLEQVVSNRQTYAGLPLKNLDVKFYPMPGLPVEN